MRSLIEIWLAGNGFLLIDNGCWNQCNTNTNGHCLLIEPIVQHEIGDNVTVYRISKILITLQ